MNPILVNVSRGGFIESQHRGAYCVFNDQGEIVLSQGDIDSPVYPRSSIKIIQALALVESGAADAFGLTDEEIALACSSHNGEPIHAKTAKHILAKAGLDQQSLQCGLHWPMNEETARELAKAGQTPCALHNNCSGKHAGFLTYMQHQGIDPDGYTNKDHPLQTYIRSALEDVCEIDLSNAPVGVDGCAIPTWALPLKNLALGFAKLSRPKAHFSKERADAIQRISNAVFAHPYMIAGKERYDTTLMQAIPNQVFVKIGAEGVFCAFVPEKGYGIALKCDDGAFRGAESILSGLLDQLGIITYESFVKHQIGHLYHVPLKNRNGEIVGEIKPCLTS